MVEEDRSTISIVGTSRASSVPCEKRCARAPGRGRGVLQEAGSNLVVSYVRRHAFLAVPRAATRKLHKTSPSYPHPTHLVSPAWADCDSIILHKQQFGFWLSTAPGERICEP